ncbi:MAG: TonB family protein [Cyanothece sp. SIO1E1]|nr:TonB family protein [Cyanothece sp. SIO1E1]
MSLANDYRSQVAVRQNTYLKFCLVASIVMHLVMMVMASFWPREQSVDLDLADPEPIEFTFIETPETEPPAETERRANVNSTAGGKNNPDLPINAERSGPPTPTPENIRSNPPQRQSSPALTQSAERPTPPQRQSSSAPTQSAERPTPPQRQSSSAPTQSAERPTPPQQQSSPTPSQPAKQSAPAPQPQPTEASETVATSPRDSPLGSPEILTSSSPQAKPEPIARSTPQSAAPPTPRPTPQITRPTPSAPRPTPQATRPTPQVTRPTPPAPRSTPQATRPTSQPAPKPAPQAPARPAGSPSTAAADLLRGGAPQAVATRGNNQLFNPNRTASINAGIDASRDAWGPYLSRLRQAVVNNWAQIKIDQTRRTKVQFTINRQGALTGGVRLVQSSGFPRADETALRAVRSAAPFAPFPGDVQNNSITINFTFDYTLY